MAQGINFKFIAIALLVYLFAYNTLDASYAWIVDVPAFYMFMFCALNLFFPISVEDLVEYAQEFTQGLCDVLMPWCDLLLGHARSILYRLLMVFSSLGPVARQFLRRVTQPIFNLFDACRLHLRDRYHAVSDSISRFLMETLPNTSFPEPGYVPGGFQSDVNAHEFHIMAEQKNNALKELTAQSKEITRLQNEMALLAEKNTHLQENNSCLQEQLQQQRATVQQPETSVRRLKSSVVHGPLTEAEQYSQDRCWKNLEKSDRAYWREIRKLTEEIKELEESLSDGIHSHPSYNELANSRQQAARIAELEKERDEIAALLKQEKAKVIMAQEEVLGIANEKDTEIIDLKQKLAEMKDEAKERVISSTAPPSPSPSPSSSPSPIPPSSFTAADAGTQTDLSDDEAPVATREIAVQTDLPAEDTATTIEKGWVAEDTIKEMVKKFEDEVEEATAAKEAVEKQWHYARDEHQREVARVNAVLDNRSREWAIWKQGAEARLVEMDHLRQRNMALEQGMSQLQQQFANGEGQYQEVLRQFAAGKQQFEGLQREHQKEMAKIEPLKLRCQELQTSLENKTGEFEKLLDSHTETVARRQAAVMAVTIKDAEIKKLKDQLATAANGAPAAPPSTPAAVRRAETTATPQSTRIGESPFPSPRVNKDAMANLAHLLGEEQRRSAAATASLKKAEEEKKLLKEQKQKLEEEKDALEIDLAAATAYHDVDQQELDEEKGKISSLECDVRVAEGRAEMAKLQLAAFKSLASGTADGQARPSSPRKRGADEGPTAAAQGSTKRVMGEGRVVYQAPASPTKPASEQPEGDVSSVESEEE